MIMEYAPLVIFAYNRADHLEKMMNALLENSTCSDTNVFVFSDGPKETESSQKGVHKVREYLHTLEKNNQFKSFSVTYREENWGLSKSVINGVDKIIREYGSVIVLEDDVIVADDFLKYMNESLKFYKDNSEIWSVGAYSRELPGIEQNDEDVYLVQRVSSCAWGIWVDRWERIDWKVLDYTQFFFSIKRRSAFNRYGQDRSMMLDEQMRGKINSWAIRFDYAMWNEGRYNVIPYCSRCYNIGYDGSGTNCGTGDGKSNFEKEGKGHNLKPIKFKNIQPREDLRIAYNSDFKLNQLYRIKRWIINLVTPIKQQNTIIEEVRVP